MSLIDPCMSCLFAKTRSDAPDNRSGNVNLGGGRISDHPYILKKQVMELLFAILNAHTIS